MSFEKNKSLDEALVHLNDKLFQLEQLEMERAERPPFPNLLLMGNPRSGSTLFTQWMATQESFAYPSNFLSRLYKAPYLGALIYDIVTKPEYQYRKEFEDINGSGIALSSSIGKTSGFKAPHEFWYFWRRFVNFPQVPMGQDKFAKQFDFKSANQELSLIQKAFGKPFLLKGKILNWYLASTSTSLKDVIYLHLYRDPIATSRSLLNAREKWTGSKENWFSWKPREYEILKDLDKYHQVAGQIYFIDKEILAHRELLGDRYLGFSYEEYCSEPKRIFDLIVEKIRAFSPDFNPAVYNDSFEFKISNPVSDEDEHLKAAYQYFEDTYGKLNFN